MSGNFAIAIDGPAGAGKSTIAKKVSDILNIEYIDTGAMYRALTYKVLKQKIDIKDKESIINLLRNTDINFINGSVYLDNKIIDEEIRFNDVSKNVSYIAIIEEVRKELVNKQRLMSKEKSIIMDGRDIGTVVLPNAEYKFFITASVEERAKRRYKDLLNSGEENNIKNLILEIKKRDAIDSNRKNSPLKRAKDSILLDTTDKTIDESINFIVSYVHGGN
jgi:CMP/dCMP kinase